MECVIGELEICAQKAAVWKRKNKGDASWAIASNDGRSLERELVKDQLAAQVLRPPDEGQ